MESMQGKFGLIISNFSSNIKEKYLKHGDPDVTRTRDQLIKSQSLYQLSYGIMKIPSLHDLGF